MSSSLLCLSDWLQPPPSIDPDTSAILGPLGELLTDLSQQRHLHGVVVDIHDQRGNHWKATASFATDHPEFMPFQPSQNSSPTPYVCGLELTFNPAFPLDIFRQLESNFPTAHIHIPPIIIRHGLCHPPGLGDELEIGVFIPNAPR